MDKLLLKRIDNIKTNQEVCKYYVNRVCESVTMELGQPLKVRYEGSGFIHHEKVNLVCENEFEIVVYTTRKRWIFEKVKL